MRERESVRDRDRDRERQREGERSVLFKLVPLPEQQIA